MNQTEIKFKFWNKRVGEMSGVVALKEMKFFKIDWFDCIPLQYVGLLKSGDEVFVGDIVQHGESIRFIEIRNGNTCATRLDKKETILLSFCENLKRLGNIYENPEMFMF